MRALVLAPSNAAGVRYVPDYPAPQPAAGEVLIRVALAGICATDLELARGYLGFAGVPGHEFVGTVERGPNELRGRRVVGEINCPCGVCATCQRGLGRHCPQRTVLGIAGRDGAFAEYVSLPAGNCHLVPEGISDLAAVFVEPLAAAAHVRDAAPLGRETRVALLGTGRLGLLIAQVLAREGCALTVFGRNPRTLAWCAARGLRTAACSQQGEFAHGAGQAALDPDLAAYDVVVEATGSPAGLRLALRLCRPCGTIVLKSTYAGAADADLAPIVIHELKIVGNRCGAFEPALRLLADQAVAVEELVSAVYPLESGAAAFAAAAHPDNLKVLIQP